MPELPEIEQLVVEVRRDLSQATFTSVCFFRDDIREPLDKRSITKTVDSSLVSDVKRRGKYMLIYTSKGCLGVHLGMSGKFVRETTPEPKRLHTHVVFEIRRLPSRTRTKNQTFYYHFVDPRRFGRLFALSNEQALSDTHPFLSGLGREPLEEGFDLGQYLFSMSRRRRTPVKTFLMDHKVVVGVGNIYASEALWRAKIDPTKIADALSENQWVTLGNEVKQLLEEAIALGGTTFRDYRNSKDLPGQFQNLLSVYEREGLPCSGCGKAVERIIQGGRSTYFCGFCQK